MLILEDLYLGNVNPGERGFKRNSQFHRAMEELVKAEDKLTVSLSEEQKSLFEAYQSAQREVSIFADGEAFIYAFRIGAKIMLDVLS